MNKEDFNTVVENSISAIREVLQNKAKEYASKQDRLHNFNVAAEFMGQKRETALWGMALKHIVSVRDMVVNYEQDNLLPSENMVYEKIGDTINYMILLKACFLEDIFTNEENKKVPKQELTEEKVADSLKPAKPKDEFSQKEYAKIVELWDYVKEFFSEKMRIIAEEYMKDCEERTLDINKLKIQLQTLNDIEQPVIRASGSSCELQAAVSQWYNILSRNTNGTK